CRAAADETVHGRSAVRGADGKAADRSGAQNEGDTRSAGEQGPPVRTTKSTKTTKKIFVIFVSFVVPLCVAVAAGTQAQRGFGGSRRRAEPVEPNVPYDGRFTFVRLRYGPPVEYASQRI